MAQIIKLKRSLTAGSKPTTSNLGEGELAMNVTDGKLFLRKSGSAGDNIKEVVTLDHDGTLSGSLNITGSITASAFAGDGSRLTNITVSQNATVKQTFTNSLTWSVEHNLSTPNAIVQVYDANDFQMIPGTLQIIDDDNIRATFPTAQSGYVVVARGGGASWVGDLLDVSTASLDDGDVLAWNASANSWQPTNVSGTGDISAVFAGDGLSGGGTQGSVSLDVNAGDGIVLTALGVNVNTGSAHFVGGVQKVEIDGATF